MPLLQLVIYALFLECWDGLRSVDVRVGEILEFCRSTLLQIRLKPGEVDMTCLKLPMELYTSTCICVPCTHALHMEGAQQMLAAEAGRWGRGIKGGSDCLAMEPSPRAAGIPVYIP